MFLRFFAELMTALALSTPAPASGCPPVEIPQVNGQAHFGYTIDPDDVPVIKDYSHCLGLPRLIPLTPRH